MTQYDYKTNIISKIIKEIRVIVRPIVISYLLFFSISLSTII